MIRSATMLTLAVLLSALPVSIDSDENGTFGGVQVLADPGGNGKGNGNGGGNGKGNAGGNSAANADGANAVATAAKSVTSKDKTQLAKNDSLHRHNHCRSNRLQVVFCKLRAFLGPELTPAAPNVQAKIANVESDIAPQPEVKVAAVDPLVVSTVGPSAAVAAPEAALSGDASLISRGDSLLAMGEIIGARGLYHRAYNHGDPAAARSIARTFDPVVYGKLRVMGLKPDAKKALEWYRKAAAAGVSAASSDIAALEAFVASDAEQPKLSWRISGG